MKNESLKNQTLRKKVKELLKKSKEYGLIKPHTEAFDDTPVKEEEHEGKKGYFCR